MSYFVEELQFEKQSAQKSASFQRRHECEELMDKIYRENPSYWPYGLSIEGHDSLYMVREASTGKAVGFTGWQERREGLKKVGYYSIGILPEHRNQGFAKEAVRKLIRDKSAQVDVVKAFIMPKNVASMELAKTLDIPVDHKGFDKEAGFKKLLPAILGAGTTAGGLDYMAHGGDYEHWDPTRVGMGVLNTALGAGGGHKIVQGLKGKGNPLDIVSGASLIALAPTKDLAFAGLPAMAKLPGVLDAAQQKLQQPSPKSAPTIFNSGGSGGMDPKLLALLLAGGAGAAGLGLMGVGAINRLSSNVGRQNEGKVRLRLPTKDPNDQETEVEIPLGDVGLSRKLFDTINRDTRRKIRQESKERTWKRDPKSKKLLTHALPHEDPDDYEEEDVEKAAGVARLMRRLALLDKHASMGQFNGKPITPVSLNPQVDPNASPEQQMADQMKMEQQSQQEWQSTQDDLASAKDTVQQHASENQKLQVEIERLKAEKELEKQKFKIMQETMKAQSAAPGPQIVAPFDTKFWEKKLNKSLNMIKGGSQAGLFSFYQLAKQADWSQEKTLNNFFGDMWRGTKENVGAVGGGIANAGKGAWNFVTKPFADLGTGAGNFSVDMDNQRAEGRGFMDYDWGRGWQNGGAQAAGGALGVAGTALPAFRGLGLGTQLVGGVGLSAAGDAMAAPYRTPGQPQQPAAPSATASTVPTQPQYPGQAAPVSPMNVGNPMQALQTTGYLYPGQMGNTLPQSHSLQNPQLDFLHQGAKQFLPGFWAPQVNYDAFHEGYQAPPSGIADIAMQMATQTNPAAYPPGY